MQEYQRKTSFKYQIQFDEPTESRCQRSLKPGSQAASVRYFMFSGTMVDATTGITVAHAVNPEEEVMLFRPQNGNEVRHVIGKCLNIFHDVQVRDGVRLTADMAVLELLPDFQVRKNLVQWYGKEFRVKIYQGKRVTEGTRVMALDQNGQFQHGLIQKVGYCDSTLKDEVLKVLLIGKGTRTESAITRRGDSGALVLSMPSKSNAGSKDDVLYVYGIVSSILYERDKTCPGIINTFTVANTLGEVTPLIFEDESVVHKVGNIPADDADFTQIAEPSSLPWMSRCTLM